MAGLAALLALATAQVGGCEQCGGELRRQVRAAIFAADFAGNVLVVLAPLLVLLALVLAVHLRAPPRPRRGGAPHAGTASPP